MGANSPDIDEKAILKSVIFQQDKKALAILYAKYYPQVKRYVISQVGSVEDAEDLVQDVFVELSKGKGNYKGYGSVRSYLLGISKKIIYQYRRQKAHPVRIIPIDSVENSSVCSITPYHNKAGMIFEQELKSIIHEFKSKSSSGVYEAVELIFFERLNPGEAAKKLGCSVEAFKKRLRRGAKIFEQIIEDKRD